MDNIYSQTKEQKNLIGTTIWIWTKEYLYWNIAKNRENPLLYIRLRRILSTTMNSLPSSFNIHVYPFFTLLEGGHKLCPTSLPFYYRQCNLHHLSSLIHKQALFEAHFPFLFYSPAHPTLLLYAFIMDLWNLTQKIPQTFLAQISKLTWC